MRTNVIDFPCLTSSEISLVLAMRRGKTRDLIEEVLSHQSSHEIETNLAERLAEVVAGRTPSWVDAQDAKRCARHLIARGMAR